MDDNKEIQDRRSVRSRSLLGAKIVLNGGHSIFDCIVKDISETGAKLKAENVLAIPDRFGLHISDGRRFDCEVRWRRMGFAGVAFVPAVLS